MCLYRFCDRDPSSDNIHFCQTVYSFLAVWCIVCLFASAFSVPAPIVSAWWEVRPVAFRRCGWSYADELTPHPAHPAAWEVYSYFERSDAEHHFGQLGTSFRSTERSQRGSTCSETDSLRHPTSVSWLVEPPWPHSRGFPNGSKTKMHENPRDTL